MGEEEEGGCVRKGMRKRRCLRACSARGRFHGTAVFVIWPDKDKCP